MVLDLYKSKDGGATLAFVLPTGAAGTANPRGNQEELLSVAQDSTGAVHAIFADSFSFNWRYQRFALVHTAGAITSWSKAADVVLPFPGNFAAYLPAEISRWSSTKREPSR